MTVKWFADHMSVTIRSGEKSCHIPSGLSTYTFSSLEHFYAVKGETTTQS